MIAIIGATGHLGSTLLKKQNTIACPVRFDQAQDYDEWFHKHTEVDTVWHVARACRKQGVRRDKETFELETYAMKRLLSSRASQCRFVYASTKVVYGLTTQDQSPLPARYVAEHFTDDKIGTYNCPEWKTNSDLSIDKLGNEHAIYALTKLASEDLVRSKCQNHKIIRVWDIYK